MGSQAATLPVWLDVLAMCVMGAVGAAVARRRHAQIYGTLFAGIVVGLGGGMLRDVLLNTRPVAIADWFYIPAVLLAAIVGALMFHHLTTSNTVFVFVQGLALGLLVTIGCQRALDFDVPVPAVLLLGLITATAGGMLLDAMAAQRASVISQKTGWMASALFVGAVVFWFLSVYLSFAVAVVACVIVVTGLRVVSVGRGWHAPTWPSNGPDTDPGPGTP